VYQTPIKALAASAWASLISSSLLIQPAQAQDASAQKSASTFSGNATGTSRITMPNTATCNAVDAIYSVAGTVTLEIAGNDVTVMFSNFVVSPPNGLVPPPGYLGPTMPYTMGEFGSTGGTRTPADDPTLTEPYYSDHGGVRTAVINPLIPGFASTSGANPPTIRVNGLLAGRRSTGSMTLFADTVTGSGGNPLCPPSAQVEITTTFSAVAKK
jgi:hypothetical protein